MSQTVSVYWEYLRRPGCKDHMGIRSLLKKDSNSRPLGKVTSKDMQAPKPPKNGRLTLTVAGAVLVMVGLTILDVRLIRDPSVGEKLFGRSSQPEPTIEDRWNAVFSAVPLAQPVPSRPPEVTFYSKLAAHDETSADASGRHVLPVQDAAPSGGDSQASMSAASKVGQGGDTSKTGDVMRKSNHPTSDQDTTLPPPGKGQKAFTVQVGAFTQPGIAQEWARRWKARGYEVLLKPVARPRTGVIYRLYLGNFDSENKADELVKRLKSREGITAFPIVVRN